MDIEVNNEVNIENIKNIKKQLTFDLWNGDFLCTEFVLELLSLDEADAKNENPEVYYGWKKLLEQIPREQALEWLVEICSQIDDGKLKYEWDDETKTHRRPI